MNSAMGQDGVDGDDDSRRRATALRPADEDQRRAEVVAATVRELLEELSPQAGVQVTPDSVLDRDLGLDSLALVELIARLEAALGIPLKEESLLEARTLGDLVAAIPPLSGHPSTALAPPPEATAVPPAAPAPGGK